MKEWELREVSKLLKVTQCLLVDLTVIPLWLTGSPGKDAKSPLILSLGHLSDQPGAPSTSGLNLSLYKSGDNRFHPRIVSN